MSVLASAVLFGTTGTARALGAAGASPVAVGALRLAVAGPLLLLVALALGRGRSLVALVGARRRACLVAAAGLAGYQLCFFAAVATTGVAVGTVVAIGSGPVLAGLFGLAIGERATARWALATLLAVAGGAVLVGSGGRADVAPLGILLAIGAGASYAALAVATRRLMSGGGAALDTMAVTFGGAALLLALALPGRDLGPLVTPGGALTVAWLAIGATVVPYLLLARGLRSLAAAPATTLGLAEPLTATLLALLVLGERPPAGAWAGIALIGAGLLLLAIPGRAREGTPPGGAPSSRRSV
jgi:DME family drug/metabolite transporter